MDKSCNVFRKALWSDPSYKDCIITCTGRTYHRHEGKAAGSSFFVEPLSIDISSATTRRSPVADIELPCLIAKRSPGRMSVRSEINLYNRRD
jgi:hypothetical protein